MTISAPAGLQQPVLDALPIGVAVVARDGTLTAVNRRMRELAGGGAPRTVVELSKLLDLRELKDADARAAASVLDAAGRAAAASGRYRSRASGDERGLVLDVAVAPIADASGAAAGAVVSVSEVTALLEAEQARDEFVSIVSHELKTPLTPLKALAQLLRSRIRRSREGAPLDVSSLDKNLATIERQVERMNGLVNDLLETSRAGRGTFELHKADFDLARVVRDTTQRYIDATADEGRHRFDVSVPERLEIVGDQTRIEQVVWNLVGNAVKYSPRGGAVRVRLSEERGSVALSIADEGIGVEPSDIPALGRRPFQRGSGTAATFAGIGLGLYFSRIVAEGHGGALELASAGPGAGATVTVRLPKG